MVTVLHKNFLVEWGNFVATVLLEPAMALLGYPLFIIIILVVVVFLLDPFPMARLQWDDKTIYFFWDIACQ